MKTPLAFLAAAALLCSAAPATGSSAACIERGNAASAILFGTLLSTLQQKIAEEGVVGAIAFCKLEALPLTEAAAAKTGGEISLRRIGVRTRNPENRQDETDREALAEFLKNWQPDAPPAPLLRTVALPGGGREVRYYRAIPTGTTCLACQGDPRLIEPPVLAKLRELYPSDEATGFAEGDLRGAVVVTFKEP